jgi:phosphoribosylformylglycinamidine synthase
MRIDLDKVPLREEEMSSYEIMLSESQERMLLVVEKQHQTSIQKIFEKWDLHAVTIGEVIGSDRVLIYHHGLLKADVPAQSLVLGGGAPVYSREASVAGYLGIVRAFQPESLPVPTDYNEVLLELLQSPTVACKDWVSHQYDSMVRTNTVSPSYDAALVRIKGTRRALAVKTDCNARYVYLNPRRGGQIAVAEAARNIVCTGATPLGITNCLNFGNPYDPEIYWQFKESVLGIGEACRALDTPVTGGNVSFYNESPDGAVHPTPVIGMLGLLEDLELATPSCFQNSGDAIILLGENKAEVGGSEYAYRQMGEVLGDAPSLDLKAEKRLHALCLKLIHDRLICSAHDCSEGGLAVALIEACFAPHRSLGARITGLDLTKCRPDFLLFGETQSRIVISSPRAAAQKILHNAFDLGVPAALIGLVLENPQLQLDRYFAIDTSFARTLYERAIAAAIGEVEAKGV